MKERKDSGFSVDSDPKEKEGDCAAAPTTKTRDFATTKSNKNTIPIKAGKEPSSTSVWKRMKGTAFSKMGGCKG